MIVWGWAESLSYRNIIYLKTLKGDSGEGTPVCVGELDASLNSPYHSPNNSDNAGLLVKSRLSAAHTSCCLQYSWPLFILSNFGLSTMKCMLSLLLLSPALLCHFSKYVASSFVQQKFRSLINTL